MKKSEYWEGNSTSTSLNSEQNTENDRMIALALSEEYARLDASYGRRHFNFAFLCYCLCYLSNEAFYRSTHDQTTARP